MSNNSFSPTTIVLQQSAGADQVVPPGGEQTVASETAWSHLDLGEAGAAEWLETKSGLESIVVAALSAEETRPRAFKSKDGLMIILRGVNLNAGHDPEDMVSIRLWIEQSRVISVMRRQMLSVQDVVDDIRQGEGPKTSSEFIIELVDKIANRISDFVEKLEDELTEIENHLEEINPSEIRSALGASRRQIATVRRYLAPQRDALDRLNHVETKLFSERDRMRLREESDRVSRYLEDLDLARERALVLQEAFITQIAQQQNTRMYALAIITAIFLPLGFITGLLGINVGGMPGADSDIAFWVVSGGLLFVVLIIFVIFKRAKWL